MRVEILDYRQNPGPTEKTLQLNMPFLIQLPGFYFILQIIKASIKRYKNYTDQKYHNFYRACYNLLKIYGCFLFFLTTWGK